jgi:hypothetical protein
MIRLETSLPIPSRPTEEVLRTVPKALRPALVLGEDQAFFVVIASLTDPKQLSYARAVDRLAGDRDGQLELSEMQEANWIDLHLGNDDGLLGAEEQQAAIAQFADRFAGDGDGIATDMEIERATRIDTELGDRDGIIDEHEAVTAGAARNALGLFGRLPAKIQLTEGALSSMGYFDGSKMQVARGTPAEIVEAVFYHEMGHILFGERHDANRLEGKIRVNEYECDYLAGYALAMLNKPLEIWGHTADWMAQLAGPDVTHGTRDERYDAGAAGYQYAQTVQGIEKLSGELEALTQSVASAAPQELLTLVAKAENLKEQLLRLNAELKEQTAQSAVIRAELAKNSPAELELSNIEHWMEVDLPKVRTTAARASGEA